MARRKGQDNLRDLLVLVNGAVHPRKKAIIEQQRKVIDYLKENPNKTATRKELEKLLGLQFSTLPKGTKEWKNNSDKFYRVMSPLFKKMIMNDREQVTYTLSWDSFSTWFDSLRKTGKEMLG